MACSPPPNPLCSGPEATPHCGIGPGWALTLGHGIGIKAAQFRGSSREGRHWVSVCQALGSEGLDCELSVQEYLGLGLRYSNSRTGQEDHPSSLRN